MDNENHSYWDKIKLAFEQLDQLIFYNLNNEAKSKQKHISNIT